MGTANSESIAQSATQTAPPTSLDGAILNALTQDENLGPAAIKNALLANDGIEVTAATIGRRLNALVAQGQIERVRRGVYALVDTTSQAATQVAEPEPLVPQQREDAAVSDVSTEAVRTDSFVDDESVPHADDIPSQPTLPEVADSRPVDSTPEEPVDLSISEETPASTDDLADTPTPDDATDSIEVDTEPDEFQPVIESRGEDSDAEWSELDRIEWERLNDTDNSGSVYASSGWMGEHGDDERVEPSARSTALATEEKPSEDVREEAVELPLTPLPTPTGKKAGKTHSRLSPLRYFTREELRAAVPYAVPILWMVAVALALILGGSMIGLAAAAVCTLLAVSYFKKTNRLTAAARRSRA